MSLCVKLIQQERNNLGFSEIMLLLRETIVKTKFFFNKTLQNLKSFFFGGYQKLPRSLSFKPLSRSSGNNNNNSVTYTKEQFYYEFYDEWQADLKRLKKIEEEKAEEATGSSVVKKIEEEGEKKKKGFLRSESEEKGGGVHVLAQKMKEMEMKMMDGGDVENLLDIEEALHYYSYLTSPVYLDIVDKFFMDMHSEFSVSSSLLEAASNT